MKPNNQFFFIFSFFPAVSYWILEMNFSLKVSLIGGLLIAVLEIIIEKKMTGHLHTLSKLNFWLLLGLAGLSFMEEKGIFFKLQPTLTGIALFIFLSYKAWKKESLFLTMLEEMNKKSPVPKEIFLKVEKHLSYFFLTFAIFMIGIATQFKTDIWLFWKTIGFYCVFAAFMFVEFFWLKKQVKMMINSYKS